MQSVDKFTLHVISHTHWDREWYLPFETFRSELVDLINELLTILEQNNDFIFHLDGQSIILQDFLEIYPHKEEVLRKYIKSGNIVIGPWYVLSDQFLSSGEATVRNLLYGIRDVKKFGKPMMVGYLPDQFGQIAQLPQILKGFNIQSAILGRGIQDTFAEYDWYGLNGDKITAISLTNWYNNAQRIPEDKTEEYLDNVFEKQKKTSLSGHILLMNGCDHLFPQKDLTNVLKKIKNKDKYSIIQSSLEDVIFNIQSSKANLPIRYGELRDDNNKQILSGTFSSRVYLKLSNYKTQTKIEKILEPLSVISAILSKSKYPFEKIKYAWKLLIQNHAHDSICGCSVDEVHKEMEVRFLKVNQLVDKLIEQKKQDIAGNEQKEDNVYLQLTNLTTYQRKEIVEAVIDIPIGPVSKDPGEQPKIEKEINTIRIFNDKNEIPFKLVEVSQVEDFVLSRNDIPLLQAIKRFKVLLDISIKQFSSYPLKVTYSQDKKEEKKESFKSTVLNLDFNKDGTLNAILGKTKFPGLHSFTVEDDLGDEYNFEPNSKIKPEQIKLSNIVIVEENEYRKKVLLKNDDKNIEVITEVTLCRDSQRVDFKTKIFNHLKNKRIKLHFPTGLNTFYMLADTPFGALQRARAPISWKNYADNQPIYNFIDHTNDKYGISFFGGGIASYELYKDGNGFSVDLLRAVGRLSSVHSHAHLQTPDAQCNRHIEFDYSIYLHDDNFSAQQEQLKYQIPIISYQSSKKTQFEKLIDVSPGLVLSSFKRSEESENTYILRLFNPTDFSINTKLALNFPFKNVSLLNLNEEIEETYDSKKQLNIDVKPYQVVTFGIEV